MICIVDGSKDEGTVWVLARGKGQRDLTAVGQMQDVQRRSDQKQ